MRQTEIGSPQRRLRELQVELIRHSLDPALKGSERHRELLAELAHARRLQEARLRSDRRH